MEDHPRRPHRSHAPILPVQANSVLWRSQSAFGEGCNSLCLSAWHISAKHLALRIRENLALEKVYCLVEIGSIGRAVQGVAETVLAATVRVAGQQAAHLGEHFGLPLWLSQDVPAS